tara:strand:- start:273 stop:710 length:438 start_codon:yes stop_codon:yes gene_type:complete
MNRIVSIDPGQYKCGLLLADLQDSVVLEAKVVRKEFVISFLMNWMKTKPYNQIILGNGTSSKYWLNSIPKICDVHLAEEKGTTLRARKRYWEIFPPRNLLLLLPEGLRIPSQNLDAVAALILLEDYFDMRFTWSEKSDFRIWPAQ